MTPTWQQLLKTRPIRPQFVLHWRLGRQLLTGTTTRPTTRKSIGLRWVLVYFVLIFFALLIVSSVLHPRHKLRYFKTAGWDDTWIKTAQSIVRDKFDRTYAFMDVDTVDPTTEVCTYYYESNRIC